MASHDVHVTPPDANGRNESKNDDNRTNDVEIRNTMNGTVPKASKIPVLVRLDNNDSFTYISTRKYSTLRNAIRTRAKLDNSFSSTSTLIYTGDDSGVHMESSVLEEDYFSSGVLLPNTNSSTPRSHRSTATLLPPSESEQKLGTDEQLTLRVLQRAVAEMEADVALHEEMLEEQISSELIHEDVGQAGEAQQHEQRQPQLSEEVDEEVSEEYTEELLKELSEELVIELSEDLALELSEELPEKYSQELSEDLVDELLKELPEEQPLQLSEELIVKVSGELPVMVSHELQKKHRLENTHVELQDKLCMLPEMPEIPLPKENLEQLPTDPSEDLITELSAELAQKLSQKLAEDVLRKLSENPAPEQPLQTEIVEQPTDSFPTTTPTPRKHVRVEQLLAAEHDIQMLNRLLSDDELYPLEQPENLLDSGDQNAGNDKEDFVLFPDGKNDEWINNDGNFLESLKTFFCGKRIRKLGYPILLCGMAVGLIYYFRRD